MTDEEIKSSSEEQQIYEACMMARKVKNLLESWDTDAQLAFKAILGWKVESNTAFIPHQQYLRNMVNVGGQLHLGEVDMRLNDKSCVY